MCRLVSTETVHRCHTTLHKGLEFLQTLICDGLGETWGPGPEPAGVLRCRCTHLLQLHTAAGVGIHLHSFWTSILTSQRCADYRAVRGTFFFSFFGNKYGIMVPFFIKVFMDAPHPYVLAGCQWLRSAVFKSN